ncbi:unnamed protein product [Arabis nemorensis]|uniref:Uncharacterized protein n=1 Tax=Arabis nemorensis TaxID=586526 RepID=A0A565CSL9_9BRAS|nr:unnamed protein product [Arabis nemorensis]
METNQATEKLVPCRLKESIGETCCIFRAPPLLLQTNPLAFRPSIVSIGPYHSDDERLQMIQQHKHRFLELFMETANQQGGSISMTFLETIVGDLEKDIRDAYSEPLQLSREELVKIMVLDGCFVLMVILVASKHVSLTNPNDTIFTLPWIVPTLRVDLLLLENQVPYMLLETLFGKLGFPAYVDPKRLTCIFFESSLGYICLRECWKTLQIFNRDIFFI